VAEKLKETPDNRSRKACTVDDILKHVWPAPSEEAERFVESIYEDRRRSAEAHLLGNG